MPYGYKRKFLTLSPLHFCIPAKLSGNLLRQGRRLQETVRSAGGIDTSEPDELSLRAARKERRMRSLLVGLMAAGVLWSAPLSAQTWDQIWYTDPFAERPSAGERYAEEMELENSFPSLTPSPTHELLPDTENSLEDLNRQYGIDRRSQEERSSYILQEMNSGWPAINRQNCNAITKNSRARITCLQGLR